MKLLIDTNALIWWMADDHRLGRNARALLADPEIVTLASLVSIWEITMKWRLGKFPVSGAAHLQFLAEEDVNMLGLTADHLTVLEDLPMHHRDPFDHLLLAQALAEDANILTSDREMTLYNARCFPARR